MNIVNQKETEPLIHFAGFTLDLERRCLYQGPQRIHLTSKPLETLIYLVENRGRVIEKRDLLDAVWKDTFVTEDNLVHAIREIRRALGDDKDNPRFVQTVPRQGYRFVCEVSAGEISAATAHDVSLPPIPFVEQKGKIRRWFWLAPLLLVIPLVIWLLWLRDRSNGARPAGEPRVGSLKNQITTGEFSSARASFSPDGKFIVYVSSEEETRGYGDLFIRQFPEGNAQRITDRIKPSGDLPVFTADGSHVVFSVPRIEQDQARHHDLWIVPAFGGPPKRFIEDASGAGFSPDKKWVAYTKHLPTGDALWISPLENREEHFELSIEGYTPRWSPGGEWLGYTTSNPSAGAGQIWICRVSQSSEGGPVTADQREITREPEQMYGLTWTPDARAIIFSSKRSGPSQLYKVAIADGSITPVLAGVGEYVAPSVSPDGSTVIFQYFRLTNDLMTATLDADCRTRRITFDEFHLWPRISPTGEKLASMVRQVDDSERLYLTDLNTKVSSQLSVRAARDPCWLNEEHIGFLSPDSTEQNTEVLVVDLSTRETQLLTRLPGRAEWLAIHPNGKRLAVVIKSPNDIEKIVVRDLDSQVDTTLHEGSEYEYLRWSPDGSALCWNKPGPSRNAPQVSGGIWILTMGLSQPYLAAKNGYCPVWSADGAAIYFGIREGQQGLWRYDLQQKQERLVCSWESVFSYDIVGSRLVFGQHKNDSQIYSMYLTQ